MALPVGYTQLPSGFWERTSDSSSPWAWDGIAMRFMGSGTAGPGVVADYNQHSSGWWFHTDTSGPYAFDGTSFYIASGTGGGGSGVFSDVDIEMGGTLDVYNTTPISAVNYEKVKLDWSGNVARLWTQNDGTGTARALRVGVGFTDGVTAPINYTQWGIVNPGISHVFAAGASTGIWHELANLSASAPSGTQTAVGISPTFAQTGTASGIAFLVNPSGTFGSGGGKLQSWQFASSEVALMGSDGTFSSNSIKANGTLGFTSTLAGTADVVLARDAADTLALRRTTNAQTFRVYNTYTDGSNYERFGISHNAGGALNQPGLFYEAAGTGAVRELAINNASASNINFKTSNTSRWFINSSGHFLATTDNSIDIGASGATRPRNIYVAASVAAASRLFTGNFTVATLPAVVSSQYGHAFVTDSSVVAAGNFGNVVAGGGANIVPVYSDGTNWRIG